MAAAVPAVAQVPQLLNYQGRVRVSGADFSGTGQFKFALVNGAGSTTYWSNDGTSTGGSQPTAAVSLPVQGGLYQVLLGDATLPNMTALTAGVFQNPEVRLRVWFSDGTNGWQQMSPDQRVAAVGYALMADDVKNGTITSAKLSAGAVTSDKIAPGAVTGPALSPTAVTDNLAAAGQGTVPSGASLISPLPDAPNLLAAGYTQSGALTSSDNWTAIAGGTARARAASVWTGTEMLIWGDGTEGWRYKPSTNTWTAMSTVNQPLNRENPAAVWTGTEMIVWSGRLSGVYYTTGGRYNPTTDTWTLISQNNVPAGRINAAVVWTGSEMIVFGGASPGLLNDTFRYNPNQGSFGTWTAGSSINAPVARSGHTAVWTGTEMIVHGGTNLSNATYTDVVRYNPASNVWTTGASATVPRSSHTAVWTGSAMIVWGGSAISNTPVALNNGSSYNPVSNSWTALPDAGAPEGRIQHRAEWTGTEMIVWGGSTSASSLVYTATGGRFSPSANSWSSMATTNAPAARVNPNMQWTGSELLIWGGSNGSGLNSGGRYRAGQTFYLYQRP